ATQVFTDTGVRRIDGFPPGRGITFVDQLSHGNLGKIRIAQKVRAIEESPPESFERQVHSLIRPASQPGQVEAFKDVENLDQRDPAGRWRRSADNFVSAI